MRMRIKRKINNLEHMKYQFEVNRRKNKKSTTMDFNNSKIKSLNDIVSLR